MQVLTSQQCAQIAGGVLGDGAILGIVVASLAGGYVTSKVASYFGPLYTAAGTVGGGVGGAIIGFPFVPPFGSVACGSMGALTGYFVSSTLTTVGAFFVGAAGTGLLIYKYLPV